MPRLLPLLPLLLAVPCAAQTLLRDHNGHVTYEGRVELSGLSQAQVLMRASAYARRHLTPVNSFGEASFTPSWRVDSVHHWVSITGQRTSAPSLRYELLVYAEADGYRYVVREMKAAAVRAFPAVAPATRPTVVNYHQPVEAYWDLVPLTGEKSNELAGLAEFIGALTPEVKVLLDELRAEMARP